MKVCVLLVLAALVACAYSAATPCGTGCASANGGAHAFCMNQAQCGSCSGHVTCNHHKDECECHGHHTTSSA